MTENWGSLADWASAAFAAVGAITGIAAFVRSGKSNQKAADGLVIAKDARSLSRAANALSETANSHADTANEIARGASDSANVAAVAAQRSADLAEHVEARQSRPYVFAQLKPGLAGLGMWDLVVSNSGQSNARDLVIEADVWPEEDDEVTRPLRRFFGARQTLPPGQSIRTYWRMTVTEGAKWGDGSSDPVGMLKRVQLRLTYTSDDPARPTYEDTFLIDEDSIGLTPAPTAGPEPKQDLSDNQKDLHKMLGVIARALGEGNR